MGSIAEGQAVQAIGYIRTSTGRQDLSPDAQREKIAAYCAYKGWGVTWIQDTCSGKMPLVKRPGGGYALSLLSSGQAGAIVVSKLDRLSRSVSDFAATLERSRDEGWSVVMLDVDADTSTPAGALIVNVMVAVAQFERERISERITESFAEQRRRDPDWKPGPTAYVPDDAVQVALELRRAGGTLPDIAAELNARGIATAKGKAWYPTTVARLLKRVGDEGMRISTA